MTFKEALRYVTSLDIYGSILGLDKMLDLAQQLGNPEKGMKYIHITGTNGKGSVSSYISSILISAGYKVGTYNSPAVTAGLDQYKINYDYVSEELFAESVTKVREACGRVVYAGGIQPTRFEVETMTALLAFAAEKCDIVVLETGLGGRYDATNIIEDTLVHVITPISEDHIPTLGYSLKDIAWNKAGIIKSQAPTVLYDKNNQEVVDEFIKRCAKKNSPLSLVDDNNVYNIHSIDGKLVFDIRSPEMNNLEIQMVGAYQPYNAMLAINAVRLLDESVYHIDETAIREGLKKAYIPFRFEIIKRDGYDIVIDGAHNPAGTEQLVSSIKMLYPGRKVIYVTGIFKDKDYKEMTKITGALARKIYVIENTHSYRSLEKEKLGRAFVRYNNDVYCEDTISKAMDKAIIECLSETPAPGKEPVIVCFGSLSWLKEAKEYIDNLSEMPEMSVYDSESEDIMVMPEPISEAEMEDKSLLAADSIETLEESIPEEIVEDEADVTEEIEKSEVETTADVTEEIEELEVETTADAIEEIEESEVETTADVTEEIEESEVETTADAIEEIEESEVETTADAIEEIEESEVETTADAIEEIEESEVETPADDTEETDNPVSESGEVDNIHAERTIIENATIDGAEIIYNDMTENQPEDDTEAAEAEPESQPEDEAEAAEAEPESQSEDDTESRPVDEPESQPEYDTEVAEDELESQPVDDTEAAVDEPEGQPEDEAEENETIDESEMAENDTENQLTDETEEIESTDEVEAVELESDEHEVDESEKTDQPVDETDTESENLGTTDSEVDSSLDIWGEAAEAESMIITSELVRKKKKKSDKSNKEKEIKEKKSDKKDKKKKEEKKDKKKKEKNKKDKALKTTSLETYISDAVLSEDISVSDVFEEAEAKPLPDYETIMEEIILANALANNSTGDMTVDSEKIKQGIALILEGIGEDLNRDGLKDTPDRVSRMYGEILGNIGKTAEVELSKTFEADTKEMVIEGDIPFYSMCEHHLMPFFGKAYIGYIPNGKVVGLSKLARCVDIYAKKPQIQERLTDEIADAIMKYLKPKGVIVMLEAEHMCMSMRGVNKPGTQTVTISVRGKMKKDKNKDLFFKMLSEEEPQITETAEDNE